MAEIEAEHTTGSGSKYMIGLWKKYRGGAAAMWYVALCMYYDTFEKIPCRRLVSYITYPAMRKCQLVER
eukprot:5997819-Pyramimonas_sp.AAC.1